MPHPPRLSVRDRRSLARAVQSLGATACDGFAAVHVVQPVVTAHAAVAEIVTAGATVRVAVGCDPSWLAELVVQLQRRAVAC